MKLINIQFSTTQTLRSAKFSLLPTILLTLIFLSGGASFISAQDTPEVCRQTKAVIEQYEREELEVNHLVYYKYNEDSLYNYLSKLDEAIDSGRLLKEPDLKYLAGTARLKLPKEIGKMTVAEKAAFQREARTEIERTYQDASEVTLDELNQKSDRILVQLKLRWERYNALDCKTVLAREKEKGQSLPIPNVITEREGGFTGTWTLRGTNAFEASWDNGAKADLKIERWDSVQVKITRGDTSSSVSKDFSATYTGKISGKSIVDGEVTYKQNGREWKGTWSASW